MTTNRDSLIVLAIQYNSMVPKEDAAISVATACWTDPNSEFRPRRRPCRSQGSCCKPPIHHLVRFLREHGLVETLADAVGLWALGLGARMIDVLYREIESRDSPSSRF